MQPIANRKLPPSLSHCLMELLPEAALLTNERGKILSINATLSQWTGFERNELVANPVNCFLNTPESRDDDAQPACLLAQPNLKLSSTAQRLRCKNGKRLLVQATQHQVTNHGHPAILTLLSRGANSNEDGTWLDEQRLRTISETIGGLAHESRNALQRAVASLDLLELDLSNDEGQMDLSRRIRQSLSDLLQNYDEVRRFSEPIILSREPTRLLPILLEAFERVRMRRDDTHHRLRFVNDDPVDDRCLIDRTRMLHVFEHLLDNSMDQPVASSVIQAICRETWIADIPAVQIRIVDDGNGFSSPARLRAFEPFYTTKQHGTGLGLSISRRIVEAHGGRIAIGDPDQGAALTVVLPRNNAR